MKILVTGGTGFIGKHVLYKLVNHGHKVRCLVRKSSDVKSIKDLNVELVYGDVRDKNSLSRSLTGVDAVIHLANIYDFWINNNNDYTLTNISGSKYLFEACLDAHIQKIVHVSSLVVYGNSKDKILTEQSEPGVNRYSKYATSKAEGDKIAWSLYKRKGLPLVVVYPGAVTGPGDNKTSGRYIYDIVKNRMPAQVLTDSTITWVDVRDVAEIIVKALETPHNLGEKYFAAAEIVTMGELNDIIAEKAGISLPKFSMPYFLAFLTAQLLTFFGDIFKISPMLGMSVDQIKTMKHGFSADGSKSIRELGITYIPIRKSVEDAIQSFSELNRQSYSGTEHARSDA